MNNLQKRILTSVIIFPLSVYFIYSGGKLLQFFLLVIFFVTNYEIFLVFRKKSIILILNLLLIFSFYILYQFRVAVPFHILFWVIILSIFSDIGGYVFGKLFKWKKFTKISPNKTFSGVLGSFIFSIFSLFIMYLLDSIFYLDYNYLELKLFFLSLILSLVAQIGDLAISFVKRIEKVKDTGKVLPGHGGILDRIDGLMFVVLFAFVLYKFEIL